MVASKLRKWFRIGASEVPSQVVPRDSNRLRMVLRSSFGSDPELPKFWRKLLYTRQPANPDQGAPLS